MGFWGEIDLERSIESEKGILNAIKSVIFLKIIR